jgi:hypothetical protein
MIEEIFITEPCPVPIVEMGEVPSKEFVQRVIEYDDWFNAAAEREVERLKSIGKLPVGADALFLKVTVSNREQSLFGSQ